MWEKGLRIDERLEEMREEEIRLAHDLERLEKAKKGSRLLVLGILWAIGLVVCAVIVKKTVLVSPEGDERH